jgi:hypothetical protein
MACLVIIRHLASGQITYLVSDASPICGPVRVRSLPCGEFQGTLSAIGFDGKGRRCGLAQEIGRETGAGRTGGLGAYDDNAVD